MSSIRTVVIALAVTTACLVSACSTRMGLPEAEETVQRQSTDAGPDGAPSLAVDERLPPEGVPDRGRDPAVVLLRGPTGDCSATFVAKDVLVTSRPCVAEDVAGELTVHLGDQPQHEPESARVIEIVIDESRAAAEDDVAFVVLDAAFGTQKPLGIRPSSVAPGSRVRAVGHASNDDGYPYGSRILREHVRVRGEAGPLFYLGEVGCRSLPGGPALDQSTGQIVGILAGPGDTCDGEGASNRYVRIEEFADLYDWALSRSGLSAVLDEAGEIVEGKAPKGSSRGTTRKPPSEVGAMCTTGADCATGVCILHEDRAYCSRACGRGDRCPATYHCEGAPGAASTVCVLAP